MSIKLYGLVGFPLTHSFSPGYFHQKFQQEGIGAEYQLFPIKDIADIATLLKNEQIQGLNVTIPYKEAVLPYLNELDTIAEKIGAVNCIAVNDGQAMGYNTDAQGFEKSLQPLLQPYHQQALILGTGGASLAVKYVLEKLGIRYQTVSREKKKTSLTYNDLSGAIIQEHSIIINTTPLGMYPETDAKPDIPYEHLNEGHLLYDLIYNPTETSYLQEGKARGCITKNGLEMLEIQAEASWRIWNS